MIRGTDQKSIIQFLRGDNVTLYASVFRSISHQ